MKSLKHFYYFTIQLVFPEQIQNKISSVKLITFVVEGIEVAKLGIIFYSAYGRDK